MPVETATTISSLNPLWPLGTDPKAEGDDHFRLLKTLLQTQFGGGTSADIYVGVKTTPDRFVVNDKADATGTEVFSVSDVGTLKVLGVGTSGIVNIAGTSPLLGFYPGAGGTRVGYITAINGGFLTINGETTNVNILPTSILFVGPRTTTVVANARQYISYLGSTSQYGLNMVAELVGTSSTAISFTYPPGTQVGAITHNATTTAYGTSSDERLKTFTGELSGDDAIAIIRADPARRFTWNLDGSPAVGWGAQTSHAVSPDLAVPGDDLGRDAQAGDEGFYPWGMDQGKRTPYLWAALAWALDKIDALEARLAALEAVR